MSDLDVKKHIIFGRKYIIFVKIHEYLDLFETNQIFTNFLLHSHFKYKNCNIRIIIVSIFWKYTNLKIKT